MAENFIINFSESARQHLSEFGRRDRGIVLDGLKEQLSFGPTQETMNKKLLRDSDAADWELRIREFRVFYEVDETEQVVRILAIGVKRREKLFVGGKEITL